MYRIAFPDGRERYWSCAEVWEDLLQDGAPHGAAVGPADEMPASTGECDHRVEEFEEVHCPQRRRGQRRP